MNERRWISVAIAFHLVAITLAAFPLPAELPTALQLTRTGAVSPLTSALDRLASSVAVVEPQLYELTAPARIVTRPYIEAGLRQKWNMFANPGQFDTYMRVDYIVAGANGRPIERVQELVFPAVHEDRPRWRHAFRDKAVFSAVENYLIRLQDSTNARDISVEAPEMVPIARHFGQRFAQTLDAERRLARVEIWYGTARIAPPGEPANEALAAERRQRLEKYRTLTPQPIYSYAPPRSNATTREADIVWDLFYVGGA